MAGQPIPHFHNDAGHPSIEVGVREFMCVGANAPFDHPHEFLDMGSDNEIICPYCSTLYRFNSDLEPGETKPNGCKFEVEIS
ncbi:zinc-finger domain-containing protein [Hoeflea prorocentri]|uniref:Zinc-finger domain-containing protein n=1 Tax=Hoeflea prorocentri TaxID=1922333 RepID=A0A9X3UJQ7_9HYPH|nr:zinc-finger domain-containing protein [Hoeflea prorocentri]MCY6380389.1 zinc-finger domain-containing protein [Hoeflea prorocentri]MDA5398189.1 zinc-finger domain-containing protein [Hoeflea prorocentri]